MQRCAWVDCARAHHGHRSLKHVFRAALLSVDASLVPRFSCRWRPGTSCLALLPPLIRKVDGGSRHHMKDGREQRHGVGRQSGEIRGRPC